MGEYPKLWEKIRAVQRRVGLLRVEVSTIGALAWASAVALIALVLHKLGWMDSIWVATGFIAAAGLLVGVALGVLRWPNLLEAAALADRRLGLKERLSSALCFLANGEQNSFVYALVEDAQDQAHRVRPSRDWPQRLPRSAKWLGMGAVAFIALTFVPRMAVLRSEEEMATRRVLRREGKRLEKLAKELRAKAESKNLKTTKKLAKDLEKLAKELARAKMTKKKALLKMGQLTQEMKEHQKLLAWKRTQRSMSRALADVGKAKLDSGEAKEAANALSEAKLKEAADKLKELAEKLKREDLSQKEKEKLAQDLKKLASSLDGSPLGGLASQLGAAAGALAEGDQKQAASALNDAADSLQSAAQQQGEQESLSEMADEAMMAQSSLASAGQPCPTHGGG